MLKLATLNNPQKTLKYSPDFNLHKALYYYRFKMCFRLPCLPLKALEPGQNPHRAILHIFAIHAYIMTYIVD